jgi:Ca2+/Na+ antiporter
MDVCADEIVSIFQALGRILGLPEALLGGTIMCWAASMGDLVATVAVVKRGMANMAITSCFAGPVFQLLCGLGCSLLFINVGRGVEVPVRDACADCDTRACELTGCLPRTDHLGGKPAAHVRVWGRHAVVLRVCGAHLAQEHADAVRAAAAMLWQCGLSMTPRARAAAAMLVCGKC